MVDTRINPGSLLDQLCKHSQLVTRASGFRCQTCIRKRRFGGCSLAKLVGHRFNVRRNLSQESSFRPAWCIPVSCEGAISEFRCTIDFFSFRTVVRRIELLTANCVDGSKWIRANGPSLETDERCSGKLDHVNE